jgi:hypothetical protein
MILILDIFIACTCGAQFPAKAAPLFRPAAHKVMYGGWGMPSLRRRLERY